MVEFDSVKIKDQLGRPVDKGFTIIRKQETIYIELNPTIASLRDIRNTWVVGSATNGIVGAWTGTIGGKQLVIGKDNRDITIVRVVNPNNTFREHFRDTTFKDSPTTSNWDTTNFRIAMHTSNNHSTAYNTVTTFKSIFLNLQTISSVTLNCTETKWNPNDKIGYFLSADGGSNWEEVTKGVEHAFVVQGQDLRLKIIFFGNGGIDTYLEDLQVGYGV